LEPPADGVVGVPDLWIVPGIAFDAVGNRLGRGKGFFDGLLREATGVTVGLAHDFQIVEKVPVEAHDVRLDFVVTPSQTFSA
jgi:5-formyltetrahydrofolate cyclo-ligase